MSTVRQEAQQRGKKKSSNSSCSSSCSCVLIAGGANYPTGWDPPRGEPGTRSTHVHAGGLQAFAWTRISWPTAAEGSPRASP